MVRLLVIVAALSIFARPAAGQFGNAPAPPAAGAGGKLESRTQKWEFGVSIRAMGGPCAGLVGTFPLPADWPEQQVKVVGEAISPHVRSHSIRASEGLKQMLFEVPQLAVGETATCFITLEVVKTAQQPPADTSGLVVPKDPPREIRKYLGVSPLIESTHAKVKMLARDLTAGKTSAWEQVQAIQSGVRDRVQFEKETKNVFRGAAGALRDGKADKEDLTATFVAVCRAAKIPARMVWVLDYCYAEFYLDDAAGKGGWYPCIVHDDVPLGAVKDFRPILEKGDNFKVPEEKAPLRFVPEFLTGKGGGGRPSVEFRRRSAD
ncbi:MAG TPA: transglutaminase-like domain-containing protein [Pirellulaceae bacterium]|nr:transglutaminase-like domain-containing protein [Pirellulaceae bacterium]